MIEWPHDTDEELRAFYGVHELSGVGAPTARWEREYLITVPVPRTLPMVAAWDRNIDIRRVRCHRKVAESVARILVALAALPRPRRWEPAPWQLFGGCYAYRPRRMGSRLSLHAWGAAIDLDPANNELGKPYIGAHETSGSMMPLEIVSAFEAEGWTWGGRWASRPDCMHFQAARTR